MKKILLVVMVVAVLAIASCASPVQPATSVKPVATSTLSVDYLSGEKMADGTTWYACAKGEWPSQVSAGQDINLMAKNGTVFQAKVEQIFVLPKGSQSQYTWIKFKATDPSKLVRGQPESGAAVIALKSK